MSSSLSSPMTRFECDQCGACCKGTLIVEADDLDILREPRLIEADPNYAGQSLLQVIDTFQSDVGRALILACGTDRPCAFLGEDNRCQIYPTRPNECVAMQAGDDQCQLARQAVGLEPLAPIQADVTSTEEGSESPPSTR